MTATGSSVSSIFISNRRTLLKRFDDPMSHIRSLHGFENFLQGPSKSELCSLAENGSIVISNVSDIRSDAFLTNHEIRVVHLPSLTSGLVADMTKHFLNAIKIQTLPFYSESRDEVNTVLAWLWDDAVKLILDRLGFSQIPRDGPWP
jgi:hypothetical protein